jgi:hypothetical protein
MRPTETVAVACSDGSPNSAALQLALLAAAGCSFLDELRSSWLVPATHLGAVEGENLAAQRRLIPGRKYFWPSSSGSTVAR